MFALFPDEEMQIETSPGSACISTWREKPASWPKSLAQAVSKAVSDCLLRRRGSLGKVIVVF
jgi:hypothetical protein